MKYCGVVMDRSVRLFPDEMHQIIRYQDRRIYSDEVPMAEDLILTKLRNRLWDEQARRTLLA